MSDLQGRQTHPEREKRLWAEWSNALIHRYELENRIAARGYMRDGEHADLAGRIAWERRTRRTLRIAQGIPKELA